jgi:BMFP domain-containing protein YqiC
MFCFRWLVDFQASHWFGAGAHRGTDRTKEVRTAHHFWRDLFCQWIGQCATFCAHRRWQKSDVMDKQQSETRGGASLFDRLIKGEDPVFQQIDRNAKGLLQSALSRLDVVSREEFDAQAAVLQRTRERLELLEKKLAELDKALATESEDKTL